MVLTELGVPLQSHGIEASPLLLFVLVLASLGTGLLFAGSVLACLQRRELRYVLIMVAVGALFVRSLIGFGTAYGVVPMTVHHLIEHSFDFLIAALVLYAVYRSKPSPVESHLQSE